MRYSTGKDLAFGDMRAVVVGFYASRRVVGVYMEGVEMGADLLRRGEVLHHGGAALENAAFGGARIPGDVVVVCWDIGHYSGRKYRISSV